ncbi:MAG: type II secretion system F family protein [Candidatus Shapirobacteria bacterium]
MPKYWYKAKDWSGKTVRGVLEMAMSTDVVASIRESGMIPLEVGPIEESVIVSSIRKLFGKISQKQVATFTRQLSTMITAGLPLTDALQLLKSQTGERTMMTELVEEALNSVRGGRTLGTALNKYRSMLGEAYIASIDAGEAGGVLDKVLAQLADNLEKDTEFRGKVQGAMIYPVIVVVGMIAVSIIMMVVVVPKLLGLYADFGSKMPTPTLILMGISSFMTRFWFLIPVLVGGGLMFFKVGDKNEKFRLKRDEYILKIPIFGKLIQITIVANSVRTLSMLLSSGVPLVDSMRIVSRVAGNEVYLQAFLKISERVQKGFSIADSFADTAVFPPIVTQMVETGESTGKLDEVLMKVAGYFSVEAEQAVKSLTSAIEPLIMIVLGIGVAFLVIAVIMPIYNLTSQF